MSITFDSDVLLIQDLEDEFDKPRPCEARTGNACGNEATHWMICPVCRDHKPWCQPCIDLMYAQKQNGGDGTAKDMACGKRFPLALLVIEPIT